MLKERIARKLSQMTPGQAAVARFLLDNPGEGAFLTASRVGERVGVSEATVIRLSRFLGYSGYQEFRSEMSNSLKDRLSTLERLKDYGVGEKNNIYEKAVRKDMETLSAALSSIPVRELDELGGALASAPAVYLAGYRSSMSLVHYLASYLSWILPNVRIVNHDMPYALLLNAPPGSLALGISFPRYSRWTVEALEQAESMGLVTASITDDLTSPLAATSRYVVTAPYKPVSFIDSFAAPMSLLNCLILSVARRLGPEVTEKLGMLEEHWKEERIYVPDKLKPRGQGI
ncbi:MAG: MurR/RpiR family transcriptional regulator [Synergistaceae bacterium]|nr:MurR/RpiR family transcriptional regulator [Synergistaceae bacterium]